MKKKFYRYLKNFISLFFLLTLIACTPTEEKVLQKTPISVPTYTGKILALGDSLTEGYRLPKKEAYPAQLQKFLFNQGYQYQVVNSGISGETSTALSNRIEWTLSQNPDIIILTSGANDAMRGIDLDITKQNLSTVIEAIQAKNIPIVFGGMQMYENLGPEYTTEFKNMYPTLAQKYDLPLIPFFLESVAGISTLNLDDQIHPNADGYQIIAEKNIWPVLQPLLEK